ncbi:hypothetical protein Q4517_12870 [Tenacibaculum sp. 1_MG-2023]|uniref:hypothetical protein n=1 Tax=Tenacibaculum sp. 1_MG-2023 TaxID=3062653 RepID=UPI0026E29864|nr:hypothetical protein [Tenacibaculum sp. 1_MG-2023]MDO6676437.1 hypothetical protein [Tenacibaculum sp. 1_MG-2023]
MQKAFLYSVYLFCMLLVLTASGQTKQMRPIDKLYSNIQPLQHKSMPQYFIEANQSGCFYELYVNGRMVFNLFKQVGLMGHTTCINDAILKSGMQEVTVKLYPLGTV